VVTDHWRGGGVAVIQQCPSCGSEGRSLHATHVVDHLDPRDMDMWTVFRCLTCRSLYPDPRPDAESIGAAYARYYTHDGASGKLKTSGWRRHAIALINGYMNSRFGTHMSPSSKWGFLFFSMVEPLRLKLDYHGRHLFLAPAGQASNKRVLDVGSGNGEFLKRAEEMGWHAIGLDPDRDAVAACRAQGLDAFEGFVSDEVAGAEGEFDVITLRHSIEHVPDPRSDLACCLRRLRPGGMLWLAWPNPDGLGAACFRAAWRGLEVPRHFCIPSHEAMKQMLAETGYTGIRVLRRGHHAASIARASGVLASYRPGPVNRIRRWAAAAVGLWADMAGTVSATAGEELVVVAFAPSMESDRA
jgi:2-polyprenyl-3-methyl-5-hydroxy-6-metoxy-1,4-benzoquinol methylase